MRRPRVDQLAAGAEVLFQSELWRCSGRWAAQYLRYDLKSFGDRVSYGAAGDLAADLTAAGAHVGESGCRVGLRPGYGGEEIHFEQRAAGYASGQYLWRLELCAAECSGALLYGRSDVGCVVL